MKSRPKVIVPTSGGSEEHSVVSHKHWLAARTELLEREKQFTHQRDKLSRQYEFEGSKGRDEEGLDFSQAWVQYHDRYAS